MRTRGLWFKQGFRHRTCRDWTSFLHTPRMPSGAAAQPFDLICTLIPERTFLYTSSRDLSWLRSWVGLRGTELNSGILPESGDSLLCIPSFL